jgi:nucleoside-diphosphate-sugar epimerase
MNKRALVAGGAGFIGSHLCDLLLKRGYEVTALDNQITGRSANLAREVHLLKQNINDSLALSGHFDEIYNLASPASPVDFFKMPIFIMETASTGHRNLLELARRKGSRILFASTSEVYGDPLVHPQSENYFGNVNPAGPRSCYDEAKRFGEALSVSYLREFKTDIRIARIFNTYGPRMRPDDGRIIPNFFIQALQGQSLTVYGDGGQTRSFCYVTDLVAGLFALMQSAEHTPVNIGNPVERTVLEIAQAVNILTENRAPISYLPLPENDPKQRKPDITKAKGLFAWEPKVSLEEGLSVCHAYFKAELAEAGGRIVAPTLG